MKQRHHGLSCSTFPAACSCNGGDPWRIRDKNAEGPYIFSQECMHSTRTMNWINAKPKKIQHLKKCLHSCTQCRAADKGGLVACHLCIHYWSPAVLVQVKPTHANLAVIIGKGLCGCSIYFGLYVLTFLPNKQSIPSQYSIVTS